MSESRTLAANLPIFTVNNRDDWRSVGEYLLNEAAKAPLLEADSKHYSASKAEAWDRVVRDIAAGRIKQLTQYSVAVIYKGCAVLSIALTLEPGDIHLSVTRVVGERATVRISDAVAQELATAILGPHEERQEGALPAVRHFHRAIT